MSAAPSQAVRCPPLLLAGGGQGTLVSEAGPALLPFFTTADACALRLVCKELRAAVREHPWEDMDTVIEGSIAAWRACFPRARSANVQRPVFLPPPGRDVVDADFAHLEGLRELHMEGCQRVSDAAFAHLRGIHTLNMNNCRQHRITDAAFAHLRGIHTLRMIGCSQASITGAAFAHLRGIHTLRMNGCSAACIAAARALGLPID